MKNFDVATKQHDNKYLFLYQCLLTICMSLICVTTLVLTNIPTQNNQSAFNNYKSIPPVTSITALYYNLLFTIWVPMTQSKKQPFIWRLAQLILLIPYISNLNALTKLYFYPTYIHKICTIHNNINKVSTTNTCSYVNT